MIKHFRRAPRGFIKSDGTHVEVYEYFTVEVWQQPFWRWLMANVYHWYDSWIFKVPGFRRLEAVQERFHKGEPFTFIPLGCKQDIKCHHLANKERTILAEFKVRSDSEIVKASWPS